MESQKVLEGVLEDERTFSIIYTIDEGDDWKDPGIWLKANPNLGVSISKDYLEAQVGAAIRTASKQNSIKTKHFNVWCGAKSIWLSMEQWNKAGDSSLNLDDFLTDNCVLGLDLAVRIDIAASVLLFKRLVEGKAHYYAFPKFYLPEGALETAKNADIYTGWAADGFIDLHEGEEIEFNQVQQNILDIPHPIQEVGLDMWQAAQMAQNFREEGLETVQVKTTYSDMSGPMRELEAALAAGRFHHPDNPILNWMASNTVAKSAGDDDRIRPVKEVPDNKIDGMVALLMAISRSMAGVEHGNMGDFLSNVVKA